MAQNVQARVSARERGFIGNGRFELEECVGRGAVGDVYAARDGHSGERVAIKVLRALTPEGLLALKHEFRAIQGVHHPNLVRLAELFEENGRFFFSMELVEGVPLVDFARTHDASAAPPSGRLRQAFVQLVSGLSALHAAGKVHRDVKSSNVLVDGRGRLVLLDFGIALEATTARPGASGMTGTLANMAPEQVLDEEVGPPADLYGVGVLLYQCLTGRLPFTGGSDQLLAQKLAGQITPLDAATVAREPVLSALCAELLALDPSARPSAAEVLRRLEAESPAEVTIRPAPSCPFVGRDQELAMLASAFAGARDGTRVALVRGQSGVGKTCLVQEFVRGLEQRGEATVLRGRCYERESLPYKALDAVIDALASFLEQLPDAERPVLSALDAELLCRAFPVMRATFDQPSEGQAEKLVPEQARARTFQALRGLLRDVTARERLVFVIDDVQWSDADSLALLRVLLAPDRSPTALWVLMFRTDAAQAVELALPGPVTELVVERLPERDAERLARQLLGRSMEDTPPEGLRQIVQEAHGHPLFISELVQNLEHGREKVSLDEALWGRVARLAGPERGLVEALSLAASPLSPDVLARALDLPPASLLHTSALLETARLVRSENAAGRARLAPYHDRIRESVLGRLEPTRRRGVHRRLAEAMEERAPRDHDALAYHWEQADEPARAVPHLERAADDAMAQLAFERAAMLYEQLGSLRSERDLDSERKLALAWSHAGHGHCAARVRLHLAEALPGDERVDQRRLAAQELLLSGRFDEGICVLRGVIAEAGFWFPSSPGRALLGLLVRRAKLALRGPGLATPRPSRTAKLTLQTDVARSACLGLSMVDPISGNFFGVQSALRALELGDPVRAVHALVIEALAGGGANKKRSRRLLRAVEDMARDVPRPDVQALVHVCVGGLGYFYGDWVTASDRLGQAEQILRDHCIGVRFELNNTRFMLYRALMARGALPALRAQVGQALAAAEHRADRYMLVNLHSTPLVLLSLAQGRAAEARAHLAEARNLLTDQGYHVQHYLCALAEAQILLYTGDAPAALARMLSEGPRIKRALLDRVALVRDHCADLQGRAALAVARTVTGQARTRHEALALASSARLAREPDGWARAVGAMIEAGVRGLRGNVEGSTHGFGLALEGLTAAGMELHAAAARTQLARLSGDVAMARDAEQALERAELAQPADYARFLVPLSL